MSLSKISDYFFGGSLQIILQQYSNSQDEENEMSRVSYASAVES